MTEAASKIRIKIGTMELEYEGDSAFLEGGIETLLETMGELARKVPPQEIEREPAVITSIAPKPETELPPTSSNVSFTTSTLAAYTDAKTGPDLALCAMATLQLSKGETACTSAMILAEMKTATGYWKSTMSGNNAASLKGMARSKKINEVANGKYALSSGELKRFEAAVAGIE